MQKFIVVACGPKYPNLMYSHVFYILDAQVNASTILVIETPVYEFE